MIGKKYTVELICSNCDGGTTLMSCVREILGGEGKKKFVYYLVDECMKKRRQGHEVLAKDLDVIAQLMVWAATAVKDLRKRIGDGEEVFDLGSMWRLKKSLEEHLSLPIGVKECSLQEVFEALVP